VFVAVGILPENVDIDNLPGRRFVRGIIADRCAGFGVGQEQPGMDFFRLAVERDDGLMLFCSLGAGKHLQLPFPQADLAIDDHRAALRVEPDFAWTGQLA